MSQLPPNTPVADKAAPAPERLATPSGRSIAYHRTAAVGDSKARPGVVFLGGFRSDMTGTKAVRLERWARESGRAFLRFDYSGHGASSGAFEDGCIGDWAEDALQAFTALTKGPQILVGSSMGGWISLLLSKKLSEQGEADRIAGFVGVAAAPDFTADSMDAGFSEAQREEMTRTGRVEIPTEYAPEPYVITRRLIEDGAHQLVLRSPLNLPFPVRLLQGTGDEDVEVSVALRLLEHMTCADARLMLVKDADHRMSEPRELDLLVETVEAIA